MPAIPANISKPRFSVTDRAQSKEGQRIVIYGPSGIGKSTLADLAPVPVALYFDSGARLHRKVIGRDTRFYTLQEVRDCLRDDALFAPYKSIIIDDLTTLEKLIEAEILATYRTDRGDKVDRISKIGWGKEFKIAVEQYTQLFADLDRLVAQGKNVILLAQVAQGSIANSEGTDYLKDLPAISHSKSASSAEKLIAWADYVAAIRFAGTIVDPNKGFNGAPANKGKIKSIGDFTRIIHTAPAPHFAAKGRNLPGCPIVPAEVTFADATDDSFWQFLFPNTETK